MKSYSSREIIKILEKDGWELQRIQGSHHHFVHKIKNGIVTVPHPKNSFPPKTQQNIFKQAGITIV